MKNFLIIFLFIFLFNSEAFAKFKKEDLENYVSTKRVCIGIEPVGTKIDGKFLIPGRKNLIVYLHGHGGPGQNDRKLIGSIKNKNSNAVLMAIPGYAIPWWKNKSSGSKNKQLINFSKELIN